VRTFVHGVAKAVVGFVVCLISFTGYSPATAAEEWKLVKGPGEESWSWQKGAESIPALNEALHKIYASGKISADEKIAHQILYLSGESARTSPLQASQVVVLQPGVSQGLATSLKLRSGGEKSPDAGVSVTPFQVQVHAEGFFFAAVVGAKVYLCSYRLKPDGPNPRILSMLDINAVRAKDVTFEFAAKGVTIKTSTARTVLGINGAKIDNGLQFYELTPDNEDTLANLYKATNITSASYQGQLTPAVGQEKTVAQLLSYFKLPTRNSAVLVESRPGVDAKGIVHLLAAMLAQGKIKVRGETGWKIFEMNWVDFNANGQVNLTPEKFRGLLEVCRQKRVILYFPNLEQLKGLGVDQRTGANDATSALLQDLEAGRVLALGQASVGGWNQLLATAETFSATLNRITVDAPSGDELVTILKKYVDEKQAADGSIQFPPDMISRLITMTNQFIPEQEEAQPRKSLDAIRSIFANPEKYLTPEGSPLVDRPAQVVVDEKMINRYLAERAGIASLTGESGLEKFILEENYWPAMDKRIIGHHNAKEAFLDMLIRISVDRPSQVDGAGGEKGVRSILLLGSSGTGKSLFPEALSKSLAKYGVKWEHIPIELGSAKTDGSGSTLTGAAPGYIGFREEGSKFVQALRANKQAVVVFEEVDKANPNAWQTLYSFLSEGTFQDANLNNVKWTRGIVVATSNYGAQGSEGGIIRDENGKEIVLLEDDSADLVDQYDGWKILKREPRNPAVKGWNEEDLKAKLIEGLERKHANLAQLIGRMAHVEILHHFNEKEFSQLVSLFKGILIQSMADAYGVKIEFSPEASKLLWERAWGPRGMNAFNHGARAVIQLINEKLEPRLHRMRKRPEFRNVSLKGRTWRLIVKKDADGIEQFEAELLPQTEKGA